MNHNEDQRFFHRLRVADLLSLAAAPTFAIMALVSGVVDRGSPDLLCSAVRGSVTLGGMTAMYLLMSAFHSAPWLKLITRRPGVGPYRCCS
jgi:hypothetical protein